MKHLVLLGHSQCGGIKALLSTCESGQNDFITNWVSLIKTEDSSTLDANEYAKLALKKSYQNCMSFPWIKEKVTKKELIVHLWFFDIKMGQIFAYSDASDSYEPLVVNTCHR